MASHNLIYPYAIAPKLAPAIWGGDALVKRFGKPGDPNEKLGESWECWDENRVDNGALRGDSIATLRDRLKSELLGNLDPERIFPILTKIIDARLPLSVQVHPGDAYAQRVEHQPNGKTECWYVMDAQPRAELVLGWARDTSREEVEQRVKDGTLGEILRHVPVKSGDVFYLPAGTLHAIGAGIIVFETQQASDLTYRIFDWNRVDRDGKPRTLHVEKAADVLDYRACDAGALRSLDYHWHGIDRTALVCDRRFIVERIAFGTQAVETATEGRPLILMALERPARVTTAHAELELRPYQTALVPAQASSVKLQAVEETATLMYVAPPARADAMQQRLETAGLPGEQIEAFLRQFVAPTQMRP